MHTQLNAVFNDFYAGTRVYHLSMGYHHAGLNTSFAGGLSYFNYGQVAETDASGNIIGMFRPVDWVMQVSAARKYLEKWNYGATIKFIYSGYGMYRSNGFAMDIGVVYRDTSNLFSASIVAKNMGFQMKRYPGSGPDDLPFDLQAGFTKRLRDAPFSFSLTAQRLHQFDIAYNDTLFNNENGYPNTSSKKFSFDNIIRHLVAGVTIYLGDHVEVQGGYNFLRRRELNIGNAGNGINGFSMGAGLLFGKLQVRYARAYYQSNTASNQLGLNLKLNEYVGFGKFGKKVGW